MLTFNPYHAGNKDAFEYQLKMVFFMLAIYACFTYSINDFVFFHLVHYRSGVSGTFAIPLPLFLKLPALLIYGVDVVYATIHHDTHHNHPRVAAKHLPQVAKEINEQLGTSNP